MVLAKTTLPSCAYMDQRQRRFPSLKACVVITPRMSDDAGIRNESENMDKTYAVEPLTDYRMH